MSDQDAPSMVERIVDAIYDAIEQTAKDANCLALQNGRVFFDGDFDAKAVARAAIEAMKTPIIAAAQARLAIYEKKCEERDPFAEDTLNLHDMSKNAAEAMEYMERDLARLFDEARPEQTERRDPG